MGPRSWAYGCGCSLFFILRNESLFILPVKYFTAAAAAAAEQHTPHALALGRPAARSRATVLARAEGDGSRALQYNCKRTVSVSITYNCVAQPEPFILTAPDFAKLNTSPRISHAALSTRQNAHAFNQPLSFDTSSVTNMLDMFDVRSARALAPKP